MSRTLKRAEARSPHVWSYQSSKLPALPLRERAR